MSVTHTPGPWYVIKRRFVVNDEGCQLKDQYAIARAMRHGGATEEHMQQAEANAWRIALCVNACEGLSNADLANRGVMLKRLPKSK